MAWRDDCESRVDGASVGPLRPVTVTTGTGDSYRGRFAAREAGLGVLRTGSYLTLVEVSARARATRRPGTRPGRRPRIALRVPAAVLGERALRKRAAATTRSKTRGRAPHPAAHPGDGQLEQPVQPDSAGAALAVPPAHADVHPVPPPARLLGGVAVVVLLVSIRPSSRSPSRPTSSTGRSLPRLGIVLVGDPRPHHLAGIRTAVRDRARTRCRSPAVAGTGRRTSAEEAAQDRMARRRRPGPKREARRIGSASRRVAARSG